MPNNRIIKRPDTPRSYSSDFDRQQEINKTFRGYIEEKNLIELKKLADKGPDYVKHLNLSHIFISNNDTTFAEKLHILEIMIAGGKNIINHDSVEDSSNHSFRSYKSTTTFYIATEKVLMIDCDIGYDQIDQVIKLLIKNGAKIDDIVSAPSPARVYKLNTLAGILSRDCKVKKLEIKNLETIKILLNNGADPRLSFNLYIHDIILSNISTGYREAPLNYEVVTQFATLLIKEYQDKITVAEIAQYIVRLNNADKSTNDYKPLMDLCIETGFDSFVLTDVNKGDFPALDNIKKVIETLKQNPKKALKTLQKDTISLEIIDVQSFLTMALNQYMLLSVSDDKNHIAKEHIYREIIILLLEKGADTTKPNYVGESACCIVEEHANDLHKNEIWFVKLLHSTVAQAQQMKSGL